MPIQQSAGITVTEKDLTQVVSSVSTTAAGFAGVFPWGPVNQRMLINSETQYFSTFGKPTANNFETYFTGSNFLAYGDQLYVVRTANTTTNVGTVSATNSYANIGIISTNPSAHTILNNNDYLLNSSSLDFTNILYLGKYPGQNGNSLKVSICDSATAYTSTLQMDGRLSVANLDVTGNLSIPIGASLGQLIVTPGTTGTVPNSTTYMSTLASSIAVGDYLLVGNTSIGKQHLHVTSVSTVTTNATSSFVNLTFEDPYRLPVDFSSNTSVNSVITRKWEFFNSIGTSPGTSQFVKKFGNTAGQIATPNLQADEMHVVIVDEDGKFSGTPGTILETFQGVSRATDAKQDNGQTNYYASVINNSSQYVWFVADRSNAASNTAINVIASTNVAPLSMSFVGGTDGYSETTVPLSILATGYNMFKSSEDVDISLIMQGKPLGGTTVTNGQTINNFQLANYITDNILTTRKDCVGFFTPDDGLLQTNINNESTSLVNWRKTLHNSSYWFLDDGYKYQYDIYNDLYRWIPMNGDIAGLCVNTDTVRDPWWSPAGSNRGNIKNIIKKRYNPSKSARDLLYPNDINPVVTFPGQGTILYGDKTGQGFASAFDRINVRRLFIVLEKAISLAARQFLFEFNDEFTRAQFVNMITPYLRDIQGRRGITDFFVVCDTTNNTPQVIDTNRFIGSIYIKPARSISFLELQFFAVGTNVQFSTIVGKAG